MSNVTPTTALEAVRSAFDFSVVKMPLSGPDNMSTPWYGLFRDDNGQVVGNGSVTDRYLPHTTDDVLALVEASGEVFGDDFNVDCYWRQGHYVSITPSLTYRRSIYGTSDNIFPRLVIGAGFDGRPFQASLGYFRDLCQNMAMMSSIESISVSFRHTNSLRPKMDSLISTLSNLRNGWDNLTDIIQGMEGATLNMVEFLDDVYGTPDADASNRAVTMHRNRTEAIFRRLATERHASGRPSLDNTFQVSAWEAYNAVQGYAQHDQSRRGNATQWDRILLASRDQHVRKAEQLALATAA